MSLSFRPLARLSRIIGALLLAGLLAGCSAVRLSYGNAPTLAYWWLDGYADFDGTQGRLAKAELETLHAWHRSHELPAYAALLGRMQDLAAGPADAAQVCRFGEEIRQHLLRLGEQAAPGLATLAPALGPAQFEAMQNKFDKSNRKWRAEWLDASAAELAQMRLDKAVERAESFYGRLEEAQLALLRQRIAASTFDPRIAWAERLRRQQDLLRTLREHAGDARPPLTRTELQARMAALLRRSLESPDPAYRAQFDRLFGESCQTVAALHNSATPVQRRHLQAKLRGYEADARALATSP